MPVRSILNQESTSSEWRQQRRRARALVRSLPEPLHRELRRIRRTDIQEEVASAIIERMLDEAERRGLLAHSPDRSGHARRLALPAIHRRALLRNLAADPNYLQSVHRAIDERLRGAHLEKVGSVPRLPALSLASRVDENREIAGDMGLGAASWMDEAPDDFYLYALEQFRSQRPGELALGLMPGLYRVLHLDPRGGSLARAAEAVGAGDDLIVQEVGAELGPTDLPSVVPNRRAAIAPRGYDLVVWSVPSPAGPGSANQVQAYGQLGDPDLRRVRYRVGNSVIAAPSPSAVGTRRWLLTIGRLLTDVVAAALSKGGVVVLRLPLCVRAIRRARPGRPGFSAYVRDDRLSAEIPAVLRAAGLLVQHSRVMEDADVVNQPFIGRARGRWLLVVATREDSANA